MDTIGNFLPSLIGALIILFIGWIIAKVIKGILTKVLKVIKFDDIADKVGINGMLAKGGLKAKSSTLVATLFYWIIMFTTLVMFFDKLGLQVVSELLSDVIKYLDSGTFGYKIFRRMPPE